MKNKDTINNLIKKILLEELKHVKTNYTSNIKHARDISEKKNTLPSDEINRVPEMKNGGILKKDEEKPSKLTTKEKIAELKNIIGKRGSIHIVPSVMRTEIVVDMQPNFLFNIIELWEGNYKVVYQPKMVDRKAFTNLTWNLVKKLLKAAIKETDSNVYKDTHKQSIERSKENSKPVDKK